MEEGLPWELRRQTVLSSAWMGKTERLPAGLSLTMRVWTSHSERRTEVAWLATSLIGPVLKEVGVGNF